MGIAETSMWKKLAVAIVFVVVSSFVVGFYGYDAGIYLIGAVEGFIITFALGVKLYHNLPKEYKNRTVDLSEKGSVYRSLRWFSGLSMWKKMIILVVVFSVLHVVVDIDYMQFDTDDWVSDISGFVVGIGAAMFSFGQSEKEMNRLEKRGKKKAKKK